MATIDQHRGNGKAAGALKPGLYVVATPIGNLGDMTYRAIETLKNADVILCEDSRVTSRLLQHFSLKVKLTPYHDHNGPQMRPRIMQWLAEGKAIALVSDAGTPLISDPGYKLVAQAATEGHSVYSIAGPSALTAALSVAGLPTDRFTFLGFPPNKSGARQKWFAALQRSEATLVFYESPKRLAACLKDAAAIFGDRPAAVCRELTKKFEETMRGTLGSLAAEVASRAEIKGEIVVLVAPSENEKLQSDNDLPEDITIPLEDIFAALIPQMGVKQASNLVAELTGIERKMLYSKAQAVKDTAR